MAPDSQNYVALLDQLAAQIDHCHRRLAHLANDAEEISLVFLSSRQQEDDGRESFLSSFTSFENETIGLRDHLEEAVKATGRLTAGFRDLLKKEQLADFEKKIDALPLESLITREEFDALLSEALAKDS